MDMLCDKCLSHDNPCQEECVIVSSYFAGLMNSDKQRSQITLGDVCFYVLAMPHFYIVINDSMSGGFLLIFVQRTEFSPRSWMPWTLLALPLPSGCQVQRRVPSPPTTELRSLKWPHSCLPTTLIAGHLNQCFPACGLIKEQGNVLSGFPQHEERY